MMGGWKASDQALRKGQRIGLLEGKREVAIRLFAKGMTDEQTADLVDCSLPGGTGVEKRFLEYI